MSAWRHREVDPDGLCVACSYADGPRCADPAPDPRRAYPLLEMPGCLNCGCPVTDSPAPRRRAAQDGPGGATATAGDGEGLPADGEPPRAFTRRQLQMRDRIVAILDSDRGHAPAPSGDDPPSCLVCGDRMVSIGVAARGFRHATPQARRAAAALLRLPDWMVP